LALKYMLDCVNKEVFNTLVQFLEEAFTVIAILIACIRGWEVTLPMVGWIYLLNTVIFAMFTLLVSIYAGWLTPFRKGMLDFVAVFVSGQACCD
jgi:hypothetical protein